MRIFQTLARTVLALALVVLPGCNALGGGGALPAGLVESLGSFTQLNGAISKFAADMGPALDAAGLETLSGYAQSATSIGDSLTGYTDQIGDLAKDPLSALTTKIGDLGKFDPSTLQNLPGVQQAQAVKGYADSAGAVGKSVESFLKQFGG